IAREALGTISNPNFSPPPDNPAEPMPPIRTKTRMLFDLTCTLSALLAQPTQETFSAEDQGLLRDYFQQIQSGMDQTRALSQREPQTATPFPEYFEHFVQAQVAILEGSSGSAFQHLLQARAIFQDMPEDRRGRALPQLVEVSTELALQSMPRDLSGEQAA